MMCHRKRTGKNNHESFIPDGVEADVGADLSWAIGENGHVE